MENFLGHYIFTTHTANGLFMKLNIAILRMCTFAVHMANVRENLSASYFVIDCNGAFANIFNPENFSSYSIQHVDEVVCGSTFFISVPVTAHLRLD